MGFPMLHLGEELDSVLALQAWAQARPKLPLANARLNERAASRPADANPHAAVRVRIRVDEKTGAFLRA